MKPAHIYGLLLISDSNAAAIAAAEGVSHDLVHRVVLGTRGTGAAARRVRTRISEVVNVDEHVLWPPERAAA